MLADALANLKSCRKCALLFVVRRKAVPFTAVYLIMRFPRGEGMANNPRNDKSHIVWCADPILPTRARRRTSLSNINVLANIKNEQIPPGVRNNYRRERVLTLAGEGRRLLRCGFQVSYLPTRL